MYPFNGHEPETDLSERSVSPFQTRASRNHRPRYKHSAKIKSLEDFAVATPASMRTPSSVSPIVSPTTSRSSTPDINRPKLKISDLVAQRFARLTKKLDEEEEKERIAAMERESKRHIKRGGSGRSVLSMAPGQLARVSIVEVSRSTRRCSLVNLSLPLRETNLKLQLVSLHHTLAVILLVSCDSINMSQKSTHPTQISLTFNCPLYWDSILRNLSNIELLPLLAHNQLLRASSQVIKISLTNLNANHVHGT